MHYIFASVILRRWRSLRMTLRRRVEVDNYTDLMSKITDQNYLLNEQYQDATNLDARVRLHLLFSTNPFGWQRWCFDQYALPATARVLEIGCGPAHLWTTNLDRVPRGWRVTLSDFASGMLEQARRNLGDRAATFEFEIIDVQQIPFEADTFDAVIANHMLYHVPDRSKALSEMQRVLKPGGTIYLATNGLAHLHELYELEHRFDPTIDFGWSRRAHDNFSLDKGGVEVARYFEKVHSARYDDALNITQAEPLVAYILSMATAAEVQNRRDELRQFIERDLREHGIIHISKESGMFIGRKGPG
jgi:ubiquinone/menaquinone biosynthesis C-methylase UbiE